jgi:SAM-dependent methyltransferase
VSRAVAWIDRTFYPEFAANWDDTLFRERIERVLTPAAHVLDVGAGAGIVAQMNFRGRVARICGVDLDPRVASNRYLDEGKVASADHIPYPDGVFDVVFSDNVLEHLAHPEQVFREVARVLKPGGTFLVKTPNRHHYVATLARLTPLAFHRFVNRLRGRAGEDTFPTLYRANTPRRLRELGGGAGLEVGWIELVEGRPEYLRVSAPTYLLGLLYERAANSLRALAPFRVLLVAELKKPREARA